MDLPIVASLSTTLVLGIATILFSIREERSRKLLKIREENQKHRLYQISLMKEFQDRIGYSLDTDKVIGVITGSLRNLFPYSTASSMVIHSDRLEFKTYVEEQVGPLFIDEIKRSMLTSLQTLLGTDITSTIDERLAGGLLDEMNKDTMKSHFTIPLVVNNSVVGLITVASKKESFFTVEEMTLLYQITNSAAKTLSRLENVLATEEGKLLSMVGSLADGVFMVDTNRHLSVINNAAKLILKINKDKPGIVDVLSAIPSIYDLGGKIDSAMNEKKSIIEKEIQIGDRFVQVFITPVFNPNWKTLTQIQDSPPVYGASVLLHDITLEKNLSKLKEDFTNMMVHELRSPLTAIKGASELLSSNKGLIDENQSHKLLSVIEEQAKRLLDQVNSILDAAKLDAGKFAVDKSKGTIQKIIKEKTDLFQAQAQGKHITIESHIQEGIPEFLFDPLRVGQVVNNLISNSLKFTPQGGIITLSANTDAMKRFVIIRITDNGIGIAAEKQSTLFSKFSQISANKPKGLTQAGTGLGLYIVKGIVEAHGGTVSLQSAPQQGTTITFTLPIDSPGIQPQEQSQPPQPVAVQPALQPAVVSKFN